MKRKIFPMKTILIITVFVFLTILMTLFIEEVLYHFIWTLIAIFACIIIILLM